MYIKWYGNFSYILLLSEYVKSCLLLQLFLCISFCTNCHAFLAWQCIIIMHWIQSSCIIHVIVFIINPLQVNREVSTAWSSKNWTKSKRRTWETKATKWKGKLNIINSVAHKWPWVPNHWPPYELFQLDWFIRPWWVQLCIYTELLGRQ